MIGVCHSAVFRQYFIILTANLSVICLGLSVAWPSPILAKLRDGKDTVLPRPITDEEASWIVAFAPIGALFANFIIGYLMDSFGRKTCIILSFLPRIAMCVLFLFAKEVWVLYLGRAISGVTDTFVMVAVPTYTSEIASKESRGALGTILQVASASGMLIFFALGPFLTYFEMNLLHTCLVVVITVPMWFLPETPYFLYSKGRQEESTKILTYLRRSETAASEEMKQYSTNKPSTSTRAIFKDIITIKTIALVIILSILRQLVGYGTVLCYLMEIIKSTETTVKEEIGSIVIGFIQLIACFCTMLTTDKFGRKPILVTTVFGVAVGMAGLGAFFYLKHQEFQMSGFLNYIPILTMMLVIFCFNAGLGAIFGTVVSELFEGPSRATGVSASVFTATIFSFITTKYFFNIIEAIGPAFTYWFFSLNCIVNGIFIILAIPETKGKSFSEIQEKLGRDVKIGM
ncbi:facilitated trehalose transporter Tret1-like [Anticarsia gemmatalis]|uniref:facilitated trehalose transporter Tret1-like n=1 Tax=Anticarsia gemmatalis TaxID=129554 RepID=UPI003F758AFF